MTARGHIQDDVMRARCSRFRHDESNVAEIVTLFYRNSKRRPKGSRFHLALPSRLLMLGFYALSFPLVDTNVI